MKSKFLVAVAGFMLGSAMLIALGFTPTKEAPALVEEVLQSTIQRFFSDPAWEDIEFYGINETSPTSAVAYFAMSNSNPPNIKGALYMAQADVRYLRNRGWYVTYIEWQRPERLWWHRAYKVEKTKDDTREKSKAEAATPAKAPAKSEPGKP